MANLPEQNVWQDGIYQLEENDDVRGGPLPEGVSNLQAKQLADRTLYLKEKQEDSLKTYKNHKHTGNVDDTPRINMKDLDFPIGYKYIQYPNDFTPAEMGLPGTWSLWNNRVEIYELASSIPDYATYTQGANFAANAYCLYTHVGGDVKIYQALSALTNVPKQINPLNWKEISGITRYARKEVQSSWSNSDLAIGNTVANAPNAACNGKIVIGKLVLGGKFLSFAGENRPPFVSGGVAGDKSRQLKGTFGLVQGFNLSGLFTTRYAQMTNSYGTSYSSYNVDMDTSIVIPTGEENSSRTMSVQYWRRIS
jgi:hypothetical protein